MSSWSLFPYLDTKRSKRIKLLSLSQIWALVLDCRTRLDLEAAFLQVRAFLLSTILRSSYSSIPLRPNRQLSFLALEQVQVISLGAGSWKEGRGVDASRRRDPPSKDDGLCFVRRAIYLVTTMDCLLFLPSKE